MLQSSWLTNRAIPQSLSAPLTCSLLTLLGISSVIACGAEQQSKPEVYDASASTSAPNATHSDAGIAPVVVPTSNHASDEPVISAGGETTSSTDASSSSIDTGGGLSTLCGSDACSCNDGLDNDGDGVTDGMDQECTGPLDDDEGTFATGIPGDNRDPKWQDCFFDGNSGAGDDGCRYHTDCLTGDAPMDADECSLTQACIDYCRPLTPPGCDCFGCCEVPFEGTTLGIKLSDACSLANLDDEEACPRCVPTTNCSNECGECELCLGKTLSDLPASCSNTTPPNMVPPTGEDGGVPGDDSDAGDVPDVDGGFTTTDESEPNPPVTPPNSCDLGAPCQTNAECPAGDYCRLGCCVDYTPQVL